MLQECINEKVVDLQVKGFACRASCLMTEIYSEQQVAIILPTINVRNGSKLVCFKKQFVHS
jgi:hypothetical protein